MRRLPIRVSRRAAREVQRAAAWWRVNRSSAPGSIDEDLSRAFELIGIEPDAGAPARDVGLAGVRRVLLGRVGYHLYYRVSAAGDAVEVLAFWHARRGRQPRLR